jgi:hypothetical protein
MDSDRNADLGGRYPGWTTVSLAAQMRREGLDIPTSISPTVLVSFADAYYVEHTPPPPPSMSRRMNSRSPTSSSNSYDRNNNSNNTNSNQHIRRTRASSATPPRSSNRLSNRSGFSGTAAVSNNRTSTSLPRGFGAANAPRRPSIDEHSETSLTRVQFVESGAQPPRQAASDPGGGTGLRSPSLGADSSALAQRLSATQRLSARSSRRGLLSSDRGSVRDLDLQSDASGLISAGVTNNRRRTRAISQRRQLTIERQYRNSARGFATGAGDEDDELPDPEVEFKKPDYATAREYANEHQVRRPDGSRFSTWGARTGRFCFWDSNVCDVFDEQNVSEFASFGPGMV